MAAKKQSDKLARQLKDKPSRTIDYSNAIGDIICERIANGESLRAICREEDMPAMSTVFRWLNLVAEFSDQYARAREEQADTYADELVSIADEGETKVIVGNDGTTMVAYDSTAVARNRLRVDTRKWVASKLKSKKYGDKIQQELTGPDGGAIAFKNLDDDQLEAEIKRRIAASGLGA